MGVWIPGMEMPKNCGSCPLMASAHDSYGCVLESNGCADRYFLKSRKTRPEWCPLKRAGSGSNVKIKEEK